MQFDNLNNPSSFYGDEMRWWYGVVQEVASDPLELGRARIRIVGLHGPDIQDSELPWAAVLLPTTGGGISGTGTSPALQPNTRVFGIFIDGTNSQVPLILGVIPGVEGSLPQSAETGLTGAGDGSRSSSGIQSGVPTVRNQSQGQTVNTNFSGTDAEAESAIAQYWRQLSPQEFRSIVSVTAVESSPNQLEQAWVAGVVLNRSRERNKSIMQTLHARGQFHAVTGPGNGPQRYRNGPSASRAKSIYGSYKNNLNTVPKNVYYFDSNDPGAYRDVGGVSKYNKVARDRQAAGLKLKVVGRTRFWIGGRY